MERRSAFQFFISQDAAFLAAFASAYALAARKAEQQQLDSKLVDSIESLHRGVEEELRMHESYAAVRALRSRVLCPERIRCWG